MRGLREIYHAGDAMDGQMDVCLGYAAVMGAEIYESIGELRDNMAEEQKKRALDGWDRMNIKRELEDSLEDARKEILDLKARVSYLESLVSKLVDPPHDPPYEAVFVPAAGPSVLHPDSPFLDIGFPLSMEIPGLTVNQSIVDEYLDWSDYDCAWLHQGLEGDVDGELDGGSNKENEWVAVPVDE